MSSADVDDLARAIREAVDAEINELAANLATADDAHVFGDNEFPDPRPRPQGRRQGHRTAAGEKTEQTRQRDLPTLRPDGRVTGDSDLRSVSIRCRNVIVSAAVIVSLRQKWTDPPLNRRDQVHAEVGTGTSILATAPHGRTPSRLVTPRRSRLHPWISASSRAAGARSQDRGPPAMADLVGV